MNPQDFIGKIKDGAIECYKKYSVLPSLTIAQAIQETGWGESELAKNANNLFGIKAKDDWTGEKYSVQTSEYDGNGVKFYIDAWFRKYPSWEASVDDHGVFLCKDRYALVRQTKDYKVACAEVYNAGYSTDPNYDNALIALIEKYNLQQFDNVDAQVEVKFEMPSITDMILTNHNRPKYKLRELKAVVIHYTANENVGAWAVNNRNYFNTTDRACSAHFIVDEHSIIRCIPEDEVAWHVGANSYTNYGESIREGSYSPNYYTIGIEMCVNSDGDYNKTYQNTILLTASLLSKHGLTIDNLVMHYHITGKNCHAWMVQNPELWVGFKQDASSALSDGKVVLRPQDVKPTSQELPANRLLKRGSQGDDVKDLQSKLNKIGYSCGNPDGIFGKLTDTAVRKLQSENGLTVDGIVGNISRAKIESLLASVNNKPQPQPQPTVNNSVLDIQRKLNRLHFVGANGKSLTEDGVKGNNTVFAIRKFEEICGIGQDGVWGNQCEACYQEIVAKRTSSIGNQPPKIVIRYIQWRTGASIDGAWGRQTDSCIRVWQRNNGLVNDGVIGSKTWTKLIG